MTTEKMDEVIAEIELCKVSTNKSIDDLIKHLKEVGVYKISDIKHDKLKEAVRYSFLKSLNNGIEKELNILALRLFLP